MSEKTQADLDALAAAIKPVASEHIVKAINSPQANKVAAQSQATQAAPAADPFAEEARQFEEFSLQFKKDQLIAQARFEAEKRALELDDLRFSIEARKADIEERQANKFEREMKKENASMSARTKGIALDQVRKQQATTEKNCSHLKGGFGREGYIGGKGNHAGNYAVMKHKMHNGDVWVRCLRCGCSWKPPLKKAFETEAAYQEAFQEYKRACEFTTGNSPSSSTLFGFSDGGQYFREQMEHVTLR